MSGFRALQDGDRVHCGTPGDRVTGKVRKFGTVQVSVPGTPGYHSATGYFVDWDLPRVADPLFTPRDRGVHDG